jgi:hypothetical protein
MSQITKTGSRKIIEIFPELWKRVYERHIKSNILSGCHDPFHAARVGQCALDIAENEEIAILSGIAGLCHNADRILQYDLKIGRKDVPEKMVTTLVNEWLGNTDLYEIERLVILDAIFKHSLPNDPNDGQVLITLKDADRLINLEPDVIMRSAQFFSDFPVVDPVHWLSDPKATFKEPKSVIKNLSQNAEWGNFEDPKFGIRLPKAQIRAKKFSGYLLDYIERVENCWEESGLLPFVLPK